MNIYRLLSFSTYLILFRILFIMLLSRGRVLKLERYNYLHYLQYYIDCAYRERDRETNRRIILFFFFIIIKSR